tara:strand:- start:209 stop:469 length:261 start_codon:yes stop_codon:yes gene_type:complete
MNYFVYILISSNKGKYTTYVGYTSNLSKRIKLHNNSKGAKFTRGRKWKLIFKEKYKNKSLAMKAEFKLKKNNKIRNFIKESYIQNQ